MSEQFTFDELNLWNWNHSVSIKSIKNPNFTMSDVSNKDLQFQEPVQRGKEQVWNLQEFNKKAQKKLKNRNNVKNFRERKKIQEEKMHKKIQLLEAENYILRKEKYCKNCKKPFAGLIQMTETMSQKEKQTNFQVQKQVLKVEGKQCFEFEQPIFNTKVQRENNRNGKIWIALGILFLVLGIHIYGFRGKQDYNDISISKIQSKKLVEMYEGKRDDLDDYFNVKVKYGSKNNPNTQQQSEKSIFKQIKVFHSQENQSKNYKYQKTIKQTLDKLDMIEQENQGKNKIQKKQIEAQHQVKFHKDFLYAIQAEIDDVGQYI